jgi:hypothetical protein
MPPETGSKKIWRIIHPPATMMPEVDKRRFKAVDQGPGMKSGVSVSIYFFWDT